MSPDQTRHGNVDEALRRRFEAAWVAGEPQSIESCLPADDHVSYLPTLEELVHIDLEFSWRSQSSDSHDEETLAVGENLAAPAKVEDYLQRFDRLNQKEIVLRLIEQEFSVRSQFGTRPAPDEFGRRFPAIASEIGPLDPRLGQTVSRSDRSPASLSADSEHRSGGFGNYELLDEIGRGGMGVVYRARQKAANRIVALKVIRGDMLDRLSSDSRTSAVDRFRHEVQAAARLEHPNIVTVYEVGEVDGERFFSMRYVEGQSLIHMVQDKPLENRRVAAYMEPIARAVHEAHAQGILHRDLKPHNILIDEKTDQAMVADFGLAKLSEGADELTRAGEVMGTPAYMPPEQATDASSVTAQSDIYAIGATMYRLLTGRPPFQAASPVETIRQVIHEEPAHPSQLNPAIDRDLETICSKCLQKEPPRRYVSAELLADDLARYLRGEPILARPVSRGERVVRWCRRNPVVASLSGLAAACLMVALAATVIGYVQTRAALSQSEENYRQARQAVDDQFTEVSENELLNVPGLQPLRESLLRGALTYYQRFAARRHGDLATRAELAITFFRMGQITELIDTPDGALEHYQRAIDIQTDLLRESPRDVNFLQAIGKTQNAVGATLRRQQKLGAALAALEQALQTRKRLVEMQPATREFDRTLANTHMNIGLVQRAKGQVNLAETQFGMAQEIRSRLLTSEPHDQRVLRDRAKGFYSLGTLYFYVAKPSEEALVRAENDLLRAIKDFGDLLRSRPDDLEHQYRLSLCHRICGDVRSDRKDGSGAVASYQMAREQMAKLAQENPRVTQYQEELASLHMSLGELHYDLEHPDVALVEYQKAVELLNQLVAENPNQPQFQRDLAFTLRAAAQVEFQQKAFEASKTHLEDALRWLRPLDKQFREDPKFQAEIQAEISRVQQMLAEPESR